MIDAQRLIGRFLAYRASAILERQQLGVILKGDSILGLELGLARFLTTGEVLFLAFGIGVPFVTPPGVDFVPVGRIVGLTEGKHLFAR
jgi:hypothetical protein